MSRDLRHAAQDYVALRRALGYQLRGYDRLLDDRYKARLGIAWLCALPADPGPGHAGAANQPAGVPPLAAGPSSLTARPRSRRCCRRPTPSRRRCARRPTARCWGCWR